MGERIRHYSLYYQSKRVAWFKNKRLGYDTNDEAQVADDGYMGHSDGATMSSLSTDAIVPVKGIGVSIVEDALNKKYVKIGAGVIDGKVHKIEMRIKRCEYQTDEQTGSLTGSFEFEGGKPQLIG